MKEYGLEYLRGKLSAKRDRADLRYKYYEMKTLMQKIQAMGTLQDSLMQVAQIAMALAQKYDPAVAQQLAAVLQGLSSDAGMIGQAKGGKMPTGMPQSVEPAEVGKPSDTSSRVRNARAQVENSTRV